MLMGLWSAIPYDPGRPSLLFSVLLCASLCVVSLRGLFVGLLMAHVVAWIFPLPFCCGDVLLCTQFDRLYKYDPSIAFFPISNVSNSALCPQLCFYSWVDPQSCHHLNLVRWATAQSNQQ